MSVSIRILCGLERLTGIFSACRSGISGRLMPGEAFLADDVNRNDECTENGKLSAQKTVTTVHKNQ